MGLFTPAFGQPPWHYAAAIGGFPTAQRVSVFGNNPDVDTTTQPEDIWTGAELGVIGGWDHKLIPVPAAPVAMSLVSDNVNDTAAGTGARQVLVRYLDANYAQQLETVTMNGTTPVVMVATPLRIQSALVVVSGTPRAANVGNIRVQNVATGIVYSHISAPAVFPFPRALARTTMFTVPAGYVMDMMTLAVGINRADTGSRWCDISVCQQSVNGTAVSTVDISVSTETVYKHDNLGMPILVVPEKNDVWITCNATSISNTNVTAGYTGLLRRF